MQLTGQGPQAADSAWAAEAARLRQAGLLSIPEPSDEGGWRSALGSLQIAHHRASELLKHAQPRLQAVQAQASPILLDGGRACGQGPEARRPPCRSGLTRTGCASWNRA